MSFHAGTATFVCALSAVPCFALATSIDLAPVSTVTGATVTLGQIARIQAPGAEAAAALASIVLGPAPRVGFERRVRRSDIDRALRERGLNDRSAVTYSGASVATVYAASQDADAELFVRCANDALAATLGASYRDVRLEPVDAPVRLTLPVGRIDYRTRPAIIGRPLPRRVAQWVDIYSDGRLYRSIPVTFDVSARTEALVAGRALAKDAPLGAETASLQDVDAASVNARPLTADALRGGWRVRRTVAAGEPLSWRDVDVAPAVERGAWVTLRAGSGAVRIEERVHALEDGQLGATVRVKSAAGGELAARVIGDALVEVDGS